MRTTSEYALYKQLVEQYNPDDTLTIPFMSKIGSIAKGLYIDGISDNDLAFMYVRPLDDYLAINPKNKKDTITIHADKNDIVGHDVKKILSAILRSSTFPYEMFYSSVVLNDDIDKNRYLNDNAPVIYFHTILRDNFSASKMLQNYVGMLVSYMRTISKDTVHWYKCPLKIVYTTGMILHLCNLIVENADSGNHILDGFTLDFHKFNHSLTKGHNEYLEVAKRLRVDKPELDNEMWVVIKMCKELVAIGTNASVMVSKLATKIDESMTPFNERENDINIYFKNTILGL